jgi:ADP-heptose:LPS heptosyltransferase
MDPDSRISQLGLLPVAPLRSSLFFESRSISPESNESLSTLASGWCEEYLDVGNARPEIAPVARDPQTVTAEAGRDGICLSLGVGNNEAKRLSGRFEAQLLRLLVDTGRRVWIDSGAGGLEADSVNAAVAEAGVAPERIQILTGSFADFCRVIQRASLYVGYDSAGQHAAAALGVPSITLFKGYPNSRMLHRWQPRGVEASKVIPIDPGSDEAQILHEFVTALREVL